MINFADIILEKSTDTELIEYYLKEKFNNIVRWAITDINDEFMTISLSYIN